MGGTVEPPAAGSALWEALCSLRPSIAVVLEHPTRGPYTVVFELNGEALAQVRATRRAEIVSGATHLFEEPGALEQVARLASS